MIVSDAGILARREAGGIEAAQRGRGRAAFTLTEMLVALAVMVVAMTVVTSVFSVTARTAAVSAAIADVENLARNFAYQLQQDLEHCDPSHSILVIHGRTQAAALTQDLLDAGQFYRVLTGDPGLVPADYDPRFDTNPATTNGLAPRDQFSDPRADILMFFTDRPTASMAPAAGPPLDLFQEKLQIGTKVSPIQVVYGHAALDKAVQTGGNWSFSDNLEHIERPDEDAEALSPLPATRWHLARRQVLPYVSDSTPYTGFDSSDYPRIWRCYSSESGLAGDAVRFDFVRYLQEFQPRYDGRRSLATLSPYGFPPYSTSGFVPAAMQWSNALDEAGLIWNVLYPNDGPRYHHVATVIEQLPAELQSNVGVHLVPGCVWFQVEFLMPEDPRNGLDHPLSDQRRDTPRWVEVEPGQTYVFVPDTEENRQLVESQIFLNGPRTGRALPHPSRLQTFKQFIPPGLARDLGMLHEGDTADNRRVRMWPYAVRVTIRVIDQKGRLDEPIVRSVLHRFD